jgi:hypothetical protein
MRRSAAIDLLRSILHKSRVKLAGRSATCCRFQQVLAGHLRPLQANSHFLRITLWCTPPTASEMPCDDRPSVLPRWRAVSDNSQKYALECLRLASDFTQLANDVHYRALEENFLASDVHGRALEIHLLRMATVWTERAEKGPDSNHDPELN